MKTPEFPDSCKIDEHEDLLEKPKPIVQKKFEDLTKEELETFGISLDLGLKK